jgi:RND family efflux transporter MFP subunit
MIFLLMILLFFNCSSKNESIKKIDSIKVKVISPVLVKYRPSINVSGMLFSKKQSKLSFKTGGIIKKINVEEGDFVKKDEILAELNLSEINARLNQAEVAYFKAKRDFQRAENLFNDSVATLEQYQNAKSALEIAGSNLKIAKFNQEHSVIKAPDNGQILKRLHDEDEIVAQGYPVFLFSSSNSSKIIRVNLSDRDVVLCSLGDSAIIYFDAYRGNPFYGIISEIAGMADPYTGTYEVEIKIFPKQQKLLNGMISKNTILLSQTDSLYELPVSSIIEKNGMNGSVYMAIGDSAVKKEVKIVALSDSSLLIAKETEIKNPVIVEGQEYLGQGSKIEIK